MLGAQVITFVLSHSTSYVYRCVTGTNMEAEFTAAVCGMLCYWFGDTAQR